MKTLINIDQHMFINDSEHVVATDEQDELLVIFSALSHLAGHMLLVLPTELENICVVVILGKMC